MQGTAAISDDAEERYQIPKSCNFQGETQKQGMYRTALNKPGNRRQWTIAFWYKCNDRSGSQFIMSAGNQSSNDREVRARLYLNNGKLTYIAGGGGSAAEIYSSVEINDNVGWTHIMITYNMGGGVSEGASENGDHLDKIRFYFNGVEDRHTTKGGSGSFEDRLQSALGEYNHNNQWFMTDDGADSLRGSVSDFYYLDDLVLRPGSFGKWINGVFTPIQFKMPQPNQGITWSSTVTSDSGSFAGGAPATGIFNTHLDTPTQSSTSGTSGWIKWTPATPVEFNASIEAWDLEGNSTYHIELEDGRVFICPKLSTLPRTHTHKWMPILEGHSGKIKSIQIKVAANSYNQCSGLMVDGSQLVDGVTDPSYRRNPNRGQNWGGQVSGTPWNSNWTNVNVFNGAPGSYDGGGTHAESGGTMTWTPDEPIPFTRLRLWGVETDGYDGLTINGSAVTGKLAGTYGWADITGVSSPITSIAWSTSNGSTLVLLSAIEVDHHILKSSTYDNSFKMDWSQATTQKNVCRSHLGLKSHMSAPPILKTTLEDAKVLSSGYSTDPKAANCLLAMPLTDENDHRASVKGSGSNATITQVGTGEVKTTEYRFYGSSYYQEDGASNYLKTSQVSDYAVGTGDFTVEMWMCPTETNSQDYGLFHTTGNAGLENNSTGIKILYDGADKMFAVNLNNGTWRFSDGDDGNDTTTTNYFESININEWHHICVMRKSSKLYLYHNGRPKGSHASHTENITATYANIGAAYTSADKPFHGYLQDVRFYNTAKYDTTGFEPGHVMYWTNGLIQPAANNTITKFEMLSTHYDQPEEKDYQNAFNGIVDSAWDSASSTTGKVHKWQICSHSSADAVAKFIFRKPLNGLVEVYYDSNGNSQVTGEVSIDGGSSYSGSLGSVANTGTWVSTGLTAIGVTELRFWANFNSGGGSCASLWGLRVGGVEVIATEHPHITNDSPTPFIDSAGVAHGPYATIANNGSQIDWNGENADSWVRNGNLKVYNDSSNWGTLTRGTFAPTHGKWYAEVKCVSGMTSGYVGGRVGMNDLGWTGGGSNPDMWGNRTFSSHLHPTAGHYKRVNGTNTQVDASATFADGDTIGVAHDADNGIIYYYKNGSLLETYDYSGDISVGSLPLAMGVSHDSNNNSLYNVNFGAAEFYYAPPTGYKAYCTANMDEPTVSDPAKTAFDVMEYKGTGAVSSHKELQFKPGLLIIASREYSDEPLMFDALRGTLKNFDLTDDGQSDQVAASLQSFDSNGFTAGNDTEINGSDNNYFAACWYAGESAATPSTAGSINPSASWVNADAGFEILQYTGTGSNATVGHNLASKPEFYIVKEHDGSGNFMVYHKDMTATHYHKFNTSDAYFDDNTVWNDTEPTNTVFSVGTTDDVNGSGNEMMWYGWTEVEGYSKFGTWDGNGHNEYRRTPFCYCGFKPAFVMTKMYYNTNSGSDSHWLLKYSKAPSDEGRNIGSGAGSSSINSAYDITFTSTGFEIATNNNQLNKNDHSARYMFAAWAEAPLKYASGHSYKRTNRFNIS